MGAALILRVEQPKILILKQQTTSSRTHYANIFLSAAFPILLEIGLSRNKYGAAKIMSVTWHKLVQ